MHPKPPEHPSGILNRSLFDGFNSLFRGSMNDLMTTGHPKGVCPEEETTVGSYFVSNYPPYSFWTPDRVADAFGVLDRPPAAQTPLGVYLHIPFCRKRCHFCYFKVYTNKNAAEVEKHLDAAIAELKLS